MLSFCLISNYESTVDINELSAFEAKYQHAIQFTPVTNGVNVLLSNNRMQIRSDVLRHNPVKTMLTIDSPNLNALYHTEIKQCLHKLSLEHHVEIKVDVTSTSEPLIHLFGSIDAVEATRVQVLVLLDQLSGLMVDRIEEIPYYLHNVISGRKHVQLQSIMEETSTNIYLQSPFVGVCSKNERNTIHLSGESASAINRAKELLVKLAVQKSKSMYHKDTAMESRKMDWILLNKRPKLRKIMRDNGCYFLFPQLGSSTNSISIYAENRINVERSIRLLNYITASIYEATVELNPIIQVDMSKIISQLSQTSGSDVLFESSKLQLFGTELQVRNAYRSLIDMPFLKENHQYTTFALELATDQREFISGKKNGKINKIMKSCAVNVHFAAFNQYNSSILVESDNYIKALDGLRLLQDELPAETSFFVPETYHRRIIGVGGKNIQKVMKKYGVYVKFSGSEEFCTLGGYFENEDNVVARTPMKNQVNLDNLKHAVTDFITLQKDQAYMFTTVKIPYAMHRTIAVANASVIREICRANNAKIVWPERVGTSELLVYGPQSQLASVAMLMNHLVLLERHVIVACQNEHQQLLYQEKGFISSLQQAVKSATNLDIMVHHLTPTAQSIEWISSYDQETLLFRICYKLGQEPQVMQAIDTVQSCFESRHVPFIELVEDTKDDIDLINLVQLVDHMPSQPDLPQHPFFVESSLSAPHPSAKNIWASPRFTAAAAPALQSDTALLKMQPSISAPIIGQQRNHNKSWPDVFFGGRDLFEPLRRASTQHVFEFIPNTFDSKLAKYQEDFNNVANHSPFVYSNSSQRSHI